MAKDPAFLFYSQDFIVGVQTLSFEDRGKYITILAQMHQQGRMDEETIRFLVGSVSVKLLSKFSVDENGHYFNVRLEKETKRRNKFAESRRNNGLLGGRPKKEDKPINNHMDNHMGNHMGNENENIYIHNNNNINKKNFQKFSKEKLIEELCNSEIWLQKTAMHLSEDVNTIQTNLKIFINELELKDDIDKPLREIKSHFINSYKIKKQKQDDANSKTESKRDRRIRILNDL